MKRRILPIILVATLIASAFALAKPTYAWSPCDALGNVPILGGACKAATGASNLATLFTQNPLDAVKSLLTLFMQAFLDLFYGGLKTPTIGEQNPNDVGAIGMVFKGIGSLFDNHPVTIPQYLASIHPITPAYAVPVNRQDIFGNAILTLWEAARNLAYLAFVIVISVIGLMVMFRSKLDPRTTISATAAIPGLIVALVLITFSSAIATFMINLGQLLQEVIKNIFTSNIITPQLLLPGINKSVGLTAGDIMNQYLAITSPGGAHALNLGGNTGGLFAALLLDLVVAVAMFILAIRVFFMLFMRYLYLLMKPIYAPIAFLFGALPGRSATSVGWFKSYSVDILTFPIVLFLLNVGAAILSAGASSIGKTGDPFGMIDNASPNTDLSALVALGILIMCTKVPAFLEHTFDVVTPSHIEKAGPPPESLFQKTPIIGGLFKS